MIDHFLGHPLDPFQQEAIAHLEAKKSVLVAAPTGTGKTLIADFLVDKMRHEDRTVIFTAPIKALSNQKFRNYQKLFGSDNVGLITGDLVMNQEAPILIMTTEILRNLLLQEHSRFSPHDPSTDHEYIATASTTRTRRVESIGAVIIDEIHFLGDPFRGTVWEELLIYLPNTIQLLGLSATLSNLDSFADWLTEIRGTKVEVVREDERAVPLSYFLVNKEVGCLPPKAFNREYKKWLRAEERVESADHALFSKRSNKRRPRKKTSEGKKSKKFFSSNPRYIKSDHIDVLANLDDKSFPALYFIYSRKLTETLAHELAKSPMKKRFSSLTNRKELENRIEAFDEENPGILTTYQKLTLKRGIAYHHAGVHVALKNLVEQLYEERLIQVLYCTSTFALGVNMPARTVIFDSLTRYDGRDIVPLNPREFMQMAGRAGRRGIDSFGQVVLKMDFEQWRENRPTLQHIMSGKIDPITSSFNLSFNSVLHLIVQYDEKTIRQILESSFRAHELKTNAQQAVQEINDSQGTLSRKARLANRKKAAAHTSLLWRQFQKKLMFLRSYNYISETNELYASGKVCIRIQFEEIFLTELFQAGLFDGREPVKTFGILTGLVQSLPRAANVLPPEEEEWYDIFALIKQVYRSDVVQDSEKLVTEPTTLSTELMPLGEMWANGYSLYEIMSQIDSPTDISGDLVGAFRRAKDLLGQLREIMYEDPDIRHEFALLLQKVSRDEVEAIG